MANATPWLEKEIVTENGKEKMALKSIIREIETPMEFERQLIEDFKRDEVERIIKKADNEYWIQDVTNFTRFIIYRLNFDTSEFEVQLQQVIREVEEAQRPHDSRMKRLRSQYMKEKRKEEEKQETLKQRVQKRRKAKTENVKVELPKTLEKRANSMKITTRIIAENEKFPGQFTETTKVPENFPAFQRGMIEDTYREETAQLMVNSKTELTFMNQVNVKRYIVYDLTEIQDEKEEIIEEILKSQKVIDIGVKTDGETLFYNRDSPSYIPLTYELAQAIREHLERFPEPEQIPLKEALEKVFQ